MKRPIALSEKVMEELCSDFTLFAIFHALFGEYDSDFQPLHNPDWVERAKEREETEKLPKAKAMMARARGAWNENAAGLMEF